MELEIVNTQKGPLPENYHCDCDYCKKFLGVLIRKDGTQYSRLERRKYYGKIEGKRDGGHIAKTPLHVARWAIQKYSKPGDWVLDPTMGAGTTAVESLMHGRHVAGMEIEFGHIIQSNIEYVKANGAVGQSYIKLGDAREIGTFLKSIKKKFSLIVNNPPYSGDESQKEFKNKELGTYNNYLYNKDLNNLAFLKEGQEYWDTMHSIYSASCEHLVPGGHLVIGVKDMMRNKEPYLLHNYLAQVIESVPKMKYVGMALLPHYPTTLFMNTYPKRFPDIKIPFYQTITVFKKALG